MLRAIGRHFFTHVHTYVLQVPIYSDYNITPVRGVLILSTVDLKVSDVVVILAVVVPVVMVVETCIVCGCNSSCSSV